MRVKMLGSGTVWISSLAALSILRCQVHCCIDPELQCIMNVNRVLTCTWSHDKSLNENYTLYYWFGSTEIKPNQCPQYMAVNNMNVGCKISLSNANDAYRMFTVKLTSSSQNHTAVKVFKKLQDCVKTDPPFNLNTKSTDSLELQLNWNQSLGLTPQHCISYKVRYQNKAKDNWTEKPASSTFFSLPSFDLCQNYTFHVQSQINTMCANSKFWSEWSEGATWARNTTVCEEQPSTKMHPCITIVIALLILLVILFAVIRQERIWIILVPQIPNPGKKFEELFITHGGNFQAWLGVSKETIDNMKLSYSEPLCSVTEDPESPGPDEKNLTSSSSLANEQP